MGVGLKGIRIIRFLRDDGSGGRWTKLTKWIWTKVDYEIKGGVYLDVHKVYWVHNVHIKIKNPFAHSFHICFIILAHSSFKLEP
jgi:hypothetical protein